MGPDPGLRESSAMGMLEQVAAALGTGGILDLVPDGLLRVGVRLPLGHDCRQAQPPGRFITPKSKRRLGSFRVPVCA